MHSAAEPGESGAQAEERALLQRRPSQELREDARAKQHDREQRFRDNFEELLLWALWAGAGLVSAMALVWALHMCGVRWLDAQSFDRLQSFVLGGVITGVLGRQLERRLK